MFDESGAQLIGMTSTEFLNLSDEQREALKKLVGKQVWLMITMLKTNTNIIVSSIVQNICV